jgi:hypothetical protein
MGGGPSLEDIYADLLRSTTKRIAQEHEKEGHSPRQAQLLADEFARTTELEESPPPEEQQRQLVQDLKSPHNPLTHLAPRFVGNALMEYDPEFAAVVKQRISSQGRRNRATNALPPTGKSPFTNTAKIVKQQRKPQTPSTQNQRTLTIRGAKPSARTARKNSPPVT